ncbi:MAG: CAP domain-containing protein [Candidatus Electrothrix sp. YB6]
MMKNGIILVFAVILLSFVTGCSSENNRKAQGAFRNSQHAVSDEEDVAIDKEVPFAEPSAEEEKLYSLINNHRKQHGLSFIPLSKSLSYVAKTHVKDLAAHPPAGKCNKHSWSDSDLWTSCCYTDNHAQKRCMWNKPKNLTNYRGNGYEISYGGRKIKATAKRALQSWKSSRFHNAVILNRKIWADKNWKSIGIGIFEDYAVVWFGEKVDPDGYWEKGN